MSHNLREIMVFDSSDPYNKLRKVIQGGHYFHQWIQDHSGDLYAVVEDDFGTITKHHFTDVQFFDQGK